MEKLKLRYPLVVEGKYDKITLSNVVSSPIVCTGGYSIFNSGELRALLRRLANETKLLILVDSDGAGKQIRGHLSGILPKESLLQVYIPQIAGKEKRKKAPGKAGLLGVEGMSASLLRELLSPYAIDASEKPKGDGITKTDLYLDGLSGGDGSSALRARLARALALPEDMTANALLEAMNLLIDKDEYKRLVKKIKEDNKADSVSAKNRKD
jgi:ribonuclease M5